MVYDKHRTEFLPQLLKKLIHRRRFLKQQYTLTKLKHYDVEQINTKLVINLFYGLLGSQETSLANLCLAMGVTCFARYILLGAYNFLQRRKENAPYCDTDSLFISQCQMSNEISKSVF